MRNFVTSIFILLAALAVSAAPAPFDHSAPALIMTNTTLWRTTVFGALPNATAPVAVHFDGFCGDAVCSYGPTGWNTTIPAHGSFRQYDLPNTPAAVFPNAVQPFFLLPAPAGVDLSVNYRFVGFPTMNFDLPPVSNIVLHGSQPVTNLSNDAFGECYVVLLPSSDTIVDVTVVDQNGVSTVERHAVHFPAEQFAVARPFTSGSVSVAVASAICSPGPCIPVPLDLRGFVIRSSPTGGNARPSPFLPVN